MLAVAIEDPAGRAQLVDFVRLRARVIDDWLSTMPSPHRVVASRVPTWMRRAALVLLPLMLGAAGGAWLMDRQESRPPTPTRVVQFVQGVDWK